MKYILLCLGLMFSTTQVLAANTKFRISVDQSRLIVVGNGDINTMPDLAFVMANVRTQAKTAKEAQAMNATITKKLVDSLVVKFQMDKAKDIVTSSYSVSPEYRENSNVLIGYSVRHSLSVRVSDMSKLGAVIDFTGENGGIVDSINFGLSNKKPFEADALRAAMADATARAKVIAEANGRTLGRLVKVSEVSYSFDAPSHQMAEEESSETEIYPDMVTVSAQLTVEYEF